MRLSALTGCGNSILSNCRGLDTNRQAWNNLIARIICRMANKIGSIMSLGQLPIS